MTASQGNRIARKQESTARHPLFPFFTLAVKPFSAARASKSLILKAPAYPRIAGNFLPSCYPSLVGDMAIFKCKIAWDRGRHQVTQMHSLWCKTPQNVL
jgi:hypothetical protein